MRNPSRDREEDGSSLRRGDSTTSVVAEIATKYERIDADLIQRSEWFTQDREALRAPGSTQGAPSSWGIASLVDICVW